MAADNDNVCWIALEGAANARVVVPGVLLRSDNLQSLTAGDIALLVDQEGLEVVLDLRTDVEVALEGPGPLTHEPKVRIEHRSLYPQSGGNTDLDAVSFKPWAEPGQGESQAEPALVRAYLNYLSARPDSVVASIRAIARARGAVLVHCAAGKDRTGVVVALALDAVGVDRELIVRDYLATAQRIHGIMDRLLASSTYRAELEGHDPQRHAPLAGTMDRFLDLVDQRSDGSAAWLAEHGLGRADLDLLRHRVAPASTGPERTDACAVNGRRSS